MGLLLLLLGCWTVPDWRPACFPVDKQERAARNLVQPYEVAVDVGRRRVYATSLASGVLGEIDADDGSLVDVHPLRGTPPEFPDLAVDDLGDVWVTSRRPPAVFRRPLGESRGDVVDSSRRTARAVGDEPGGGARGLGEAEGQPVLQRFTAEGPVGAPLVLDAVSRGLVDLGDRVGVLQDDEMEVYSLPDLVVTERCSLLFPAQHGAVLPDGTVLVTDSHRVGRAGCGALAAAEWAGGEENKDVVVVGDYGLVLDRLGGLGAADPNLGVARAYDRDGPLADAPIVTGKNTGFGAVDAASGRLWMNSEGTAEILALDPATGAIAARTRTGVFIDGVVVDPEVAGRRYLTGRLSNTLVTFGPMGDHAEVDDVFWPYSPQVDVTHDVLWVLSETSSVVHARDRVSLAPLGALDAGLGHNTGLTFSTIAVHPQRGTLFVAQAQADEVVEIAPDIVGASDAPAPARVIQRWSLGGPLVEDPDEIGELTVLVADDGGVLLARSNDGRVQRLLPGAPEVATAWLDPAGHAGLPDENLTDFARLDGDTLYIGAHAFDAATLARRPEADLRATRLVGGMPGDPNRRVALDTTTLSLQSIDVNQQVWSVVRYASKPLHAFIVRPEPLLGSIFMARGAQGTVCPVDVDRFGG